MNLSGMKPLLWRPLQLALVMSVLSPYADCAGAGPYLTPPPIILVGRRCCGDNQVFSDNGCVSAASTAGYFDPPVYISNDSGATPLGIVEWYVKPLKCTNSGRMKLEYHKVGGNDTRLERSHDKVVLLRWKEYLIFKTTDDYCVDHRHDRGYEAVICRVDTEKVCSGATCVQKCCGEKEVLSFSEGSCIHNPYKEDLAFDFRSLTGGVISAPEDIVVVNRIQGHCNSLEYLNPQEDSTEGYYLLQNGHLYEETTGTRHPINHYCLVHVLELLTDVAFVCRDPPPTALQVKIKLQIAGLVISNVFLVVTVILCNLMVPHLRDIQSLCLVAYMTALFVANCTLLTSHWFFYSLSSIHCIINGILLQLSFLATFFWLNVMCFDIWRIIRSTIQLVPLTGISANSQKMFKLYSVYAWGVPLLITTVSVILHYLSDHLDLQGILRPAYGLRSCWSSGELAVFAHFYAFVAVLFFFNILFICHTIFMLRRAGRTFLCCKQVSAIGASRRHMEAFQHRFVLFTLMFVCWIAEILSWKIPPKEIWIVTDVLNSLQGFFVFVIFMSSKKRRGMTRDSIQSKITSMRQSAPLEHMSSFKCNAHTSVISQSTDISQSQNVTSNPNENST